MTNATDEQKGNAFDVVVSAYTAVKGSNAAIESITHDPNSQFLHSVLESVLSACCDLIESKTAEEVMAACLIADVIRKELELDLPEHWGANGRLINAAR